MNENFNDIEILIDWLQLTIFPGSNYDDSLLHFFTIHGLLKWI